ncbi:amino acid adenylation domain-containing protein [Niallia sp. 03091]|uniref:amino acid adenylation domain-containing protein n=1 Tax=unclassified Niallia TaxID=2837522 RepID=UPI0040439BB4
MIGTIKSSITFCEMIEKQVKQNPHNIAIYDDGDMITYNQLNQKANQFANYLLDKGIKREDRVGVVLKRSINMIISILGIAKAGAAYLPADIKFPKERINYMMNDGKVKLVITEENIAHIFKDHLQKCILQNIDLSNFNNENPNITYSLDNLLYVLYTSGTTGEPKGVMIENGNVSNYINAFSKEFNINQNDKMLQISVCSFDIYVEEVYPILANGGTLIIVNDDIAANPEQIIDLIKEQNATMLSGFPYLLNELGKYQIPSSIHTLISGGDVLRKEFINKFKDVNIYNTYGPSETTVCCTYYKYQGDETESIPVGKPISGVNVYIMNDKLEILGKNEVGEICISGKGVGRGYLNKDEMTEKVFVVNPLDKSQRLYRSGDLGYVRDDGNIVFIKRKDNQVMIGGKRVEPAEVESYLNQHPKIDYALVKAHLDANGYHYICAYVLFKNEKLSKKEIQKFLSNYITPFMIPEYFIEIHDLPKTSNGKIDRKNLPMVLK